MRGISEVIGIVTLDQLLKTSPGPVFLICEIKFQEYLAHRDTVRVNPKFPKVLLVHSNNLRR